MDALVASQVEQTYLLSSFSDARERRLSRRLMSLWLKRELFGIGTLAMLASAQAEENGPHTPPRRPAVFLAHASPLHTSPPIPSLSSQHWSGHVGIVGCVGGVGFNRTVSISVLRFNALGLSLLGTPKLSACALGLNPSFTISEDFF
jgi:hypothetical protein